MFQRLGLLLLVCAGTLLAVAACPTFSEDDRYLCGESIGCPPSYTCESRECVPVEEENDPCRGVTCGEGQVCDPDSGTCVDEDHDPCRGVTCDENQVCDTRSGTCVDDCRVGACEDPQVCRDDTGACVDCVTGDDCPIGTCVDNLCVISCDEMCQASIEVCPSEEAVDCRCGAVLTHCLTEWQAVLDCSGSHPNIVCDVGEGFPYPEGCRDEQVSLMNCMTSIEPLTCEEYCSSMAYAPCDHAPGYEQCESACTDASNGECVDAVHAVRFCAADYDLVNPSGFSCDISDKPYPPGCQVEQEAANACFEESPLTCADICVDMNAAQCDGWSAWKCDEDCGTMSVECLSALEHYVECVNTAEPAFTCGGNGLLEAGACANVLAELEACFAIGASYCQTMCDSLRVTSCGASLPEVGCIEKCLAARSDCSQDFMLLMDCHTGVPYCDGDHLLPEACGEPFAAFLVCMDDAP